MAAALTPATRVLLIETASNPLLRIPDLPALGRLARQRGFALVVDASISTPMLVRPLEHGAAVVVHSLSKYVGGHGDLIGGIAVGGGKVMARLAGQRTHDRRGDGSVLCLAGAARAAHAGACACTASAPRRRRWRRCWPATRGCGPCITPDCRAIPDRARCRRLLAAPGAMVSFQLASGAAARRFYDRVRVITRAASFGEVTSLLTHPATFSHKGLSPAERARLGIDDGLLRLSVGLEDPADLRGGPATGAGVSA